MSVKYNGRDKKIYINGKRVGATEINVCVDSVHINYEKDYDDFRYDYCNSHQIRIRLMEKLGLDYCEVTFVDDGRLVIADNVAWDELGLALNINPDRVKPLNDIREHRWVFFIRERWI